MINTKTTYALTYNKDRKCKHCSGPIADQAHKRRHFCENEILSDGSVKSCHDDYHTERKAEAEAPYRAEIAFQKKMQKAIAALCHVTGQKEVTVDQLDMYGIDLSRAKPHEPKGNNLYIFNFTGYRIDQQSTFIFKINTNDDL